MKIMIQAVALSLILSASFSVNAQVLKPAKPALFSNVAPTVEANTAELDKAFIAKEGSTLKLNFSNNFSFTGTVVSSVQRYGKLSCIVIKSSSVSNTLFSISKRINEDNSISYVGRILNEGYADGYELKKSNDGHYAFHKVKTEELLQDY